MSHSQPRMAVLLNEAGRSAQPSGEKVEEPLADLSGIRAVHVAHCLDAGLAEHDVIEAVDQLA